MDKSELREKIIEGVKAGKTYYALAKELSVNSLRVRNIAIKAGVVSLKAYGKRKPKPEAKLEAKPEAKKVTEPVIVPDEN